jgi:Uma2 family endonuclease
MAVSHVEIIRGQGTHLMRAVMADVPSNILAHRALTGADHWDEFWEGVLHMPPMPNREHQDFQWALETWLRRFWASPRQGRVYHEVNLAPPGGWPTDYRIPDLVLLAPDRFSIDRNEYFEGPPTVVIEIRSPGDETLEKLPFYAKLGVPEVWVIDRDTKRPEVHVLKGPRYVRKPALPDGWMHSEITGVQLRGVKRRLLALRIAGDESTERLLPESDLHE